MMPAAIVLVALVVAANSASAKPRPTWQATGNVDPITGTSSCVVAATDRAAGMSFTRSGTIYPVVELNSAHGLLVGVSSGGRFRLSTGDILWRVDDLPYRELKAADNPAGIDSAVPADATAQLTQQAMTLTRAMTATSTLASGRRAWAMLAELRAGRGLQFRQANPNSAYGLPQQQTLLTGQVTKTGLRPVPIDASFHAALATCKIGDRPA